MCQCCVVLTSVDLCFKHCMCFVILFRPVYYLTFLISEFSVIYYFIMSIFIEVFADG